MIINYLLNELLFIWFLSVDKAQNIFYGKFEISMKSYIARVYMLIICLVSSLNGMTVLDSVPLLAISQVSQQTWYIQQHLSQFFFYNDTLKVMMYKNMASFRHAVD